MATLYADPLGPGPWYAPWQGAPVNAEPELIRYTVVGVHDGSEYPGEGWGFRRGAIPDAVYDDLRYASAAEALRNSLAGTPYARGPAQEET